MRRFVGRGQQGLGVESGALLAMVLTFGAMSCSSGSEPGKEISGEERKPGDRPDLAQLDPLDATYCDLELVLLDKCVRCHSDEPLHGAPLSLATHETVRMWSDAMELVVRGEIMPPTDAELDPAVESLTADEKRVLLGWLQNGAPGCGE